MNEKYLYPDDFPREDEALRRAAEDFDLPFDESYWEQAEKLLDAAAAEEGIVIPPTPPVQVNGEGARGRKRYWLLLLLLLIGGCGTWLVLDRQSNNNAQLTSLKTNTTNTTTAQNQQNTTAQHTTTNHTTSSQANTNANTQAATVNSQSAQTVLTPTNTTQPKVNNNLNQSPRRNAAATNTVTNTSTSSNQAATSHNNTSNTTKTSSTNASQQDLSLAPNTSNNTTQLNTTQPSTIDTSDNITLPADVASATTNTSTLPAIEGATNAALVRAAVPVMLEGIKAVIPATTPPLNQALLPITAQVQKSTEQPRIMNRFSFAVSGGIAIFNGVADSLDYNFKRLSVSPQVGVSAAWQLSPKVSIQVGANVNYQNKLERTVTRETCNCNYAVLDSLGVQTFTLRPKAVYFLETPIGVRFSLAPRHYLSVSGGIAWRLGMKADVKNYDDVAPRVSYRYDAGAAAIAPFFGIGYDYAFTKHFSLNIRASYRHNWLDGSVYPTARPLGLWGTSIGLSYQF